MHYSFLGMVVTQWTRLPPPPPADLAEKTVVIVGANTGIGLEAAKHFARMKPARLVLGARSEARGRRAIEQIAKETGYAAELQLIDLADFASVQAFAARLKDDPVDVLVANAGVAEAEFALTKDGWERTLQVNHLGTALLCLLLLPQLARGGALHKSHPRLVVTSSGMHMTVQLGAEYARQPSVLRALNTPDAFARPNFPQYSFTKLLNVLFVRALSAHLAPAAGVVPTAVCPGFCVSELRRNVSWREEVVYKLMEWTMGRSAEQGARPVVYAALGPDGRDGRHVEFFRGAYVDSCEVVGPGDWVLSREGWEMQERVWRETIEILEEVAPDVRKIVKEYLQ
ncbi:short chain dehydrogenase [Phanerochaete sordida]|uniref:Short chain dehydrogenase n=1 Tax=Phanerochaete sordida TaxID=48140 RepID=A0A9P3GAF1_9APHY|nr:short chain dehydrogenase [Phanerochaete sordida]